MPAEQSVVPATPPAATGNLAPEDTHGNAAQPEMFEEEADLCASIFKGLVFYLAREVPQEALLLVIRAFGGTAGWQGEGSPITETDESITHQVRFDGCIWLKLVLCSATLIVAGSLVFKLTLHTLLALGA